MGPTDRREGLGWSIAVEVVVLWIILLGAGYFTTASAANWSFTPILKVSEIYTDNVTLAAPGLEEEDYVTDLTPGISLRGDSPRVQTSLDYRLQHLAYANNRDNNDTYHKIQGETNAEIIPRHFFMDAGVDLSQRNLGQTRLEPLDNINIIGNRIDVVSASASPYYQGRIGGVSDLLVKYGYNILRYVDNPDEDVLSDSDIQRLDINLNGIERSALDWYLNYSGLLEKREDGEDFRRTSVSGRLQYQVSRTFDALVEGGYENSDVGTAAFVVNGSYWAAGLGWHPSRRVRVDLLYGDRYKSVSAEWRPSSRTSMELAWRDRGVGLNPEEAWSGELKLGTRNTIWGAGYTEQTATVQQVQIAETVFVDPDTGQVVLDPGPGDVVVPVDRFTLSDQLFLRKRANMFAEINGRRSSLSVMVYHETREFLSSDDQESSDGGLVSLSMQTTRRISLLATGSSERVDFFDGFTDELWHASFGITRRFGRDDSAGLILRRSQLDSDDETREYVENRVMARIEMRF